jgi:thiol-disulfide isomerase/thioredoxin
MDAAGRRAILPPMRKILLSLAGSLVVASGLWIGTGTTALAALPDKITDVPKAPYDEAADGRAELAAAIARAKAANKRVLVKFGANWCPDCRVLAGALEIPDIKSYAESKFELVSIDVGRRNKNLDLAAKYGQGLKGVPTVVVVDPKTDTAVQGLNTLALSDARDMAPAAILDVLKSWGG